MFQQCFFRKHTQAWNPNELILIIDYCNLTNFSFLLNSCRFLQNLLSLANLFLSLNVLWTLVLYSNYKHLKLITSDQYTLKEIGGKDWMSDFLRFRFHCLHCKSYQLSLLDFWFHGWILAVVVTEWCFSVWHNWHHHFPFRQSCQSKQRRFETYRWIHFPWSRPWWHQ